MIETIFAVNLERRPRTNSSLFSYGSAIPAADNMRTMEGSLFRSNPKGLKGQSDNTVQFRKMKRVCQSCGKEFQSFTEGVVYSSAVKGSLFFCSDNCCAKYLDGTLDSRK
jgi:hypothetical protein